MCLSALPSIGFTLEQPALSPEPCTCTSQCAAPRSSSLAPYPPALAARGGASTPSQQLDQPEPVGVGYGWESFVDNDNHS